jgi:hypothetical protein
MKMNLRSVSFHPTNTGYADAGGGVAAGQLAVHSDTRQ